MLTRAFSQARGVCWAVGAWMVLTSVTCLWLSQQALTQRQEIFETDARIAHRLLSQRAVQHDAVLATLALLHSSAMPGDRMDALQRLPAVYPQILAVASRSGSMHWPIGPWGPALDEAEANARRLGRPVLAWFDADSAQFWMLQAATPASYALRIDARTMVPWAEWPVAKGSSVQTALALGTQHLVIQLGDLHTSPWQFKFHKRLATDSQPFDVVLRQSLSWSALPWGRMLAAAALLALLLGGMALVQRQRRERHRVEELLRLGQVSRLNAMGELAAGMAHELNQPLTALLANTQASRRLLADDPPDIDTARSAMEQAVQQARRASDVVTRLRRAVERPDMVAPQQRLSLDDAARNALYLMEPETHRAQVRATLVCACTVYALGDPVALEQIIHNLLSNAVQALERGPLGERHVVVHVDVGAGLARLTVQDNGPGISAEVLPHVFEPFFSTREGGLGLGLSLCETLAQGMGGQLQASHARPQGAIFTLTLPEDKGSAG